MNARMLIEAVVKGHNANEVVTRIHEGILAEGPSNKDYVALADHIKMHNSITAPENHFNDTHLSSLADHMKSQNSAFMKDRWLGYVKGSNGKNGGKTS
jgi:hypothetical protein